MAREIGSRGCIGVLCTAVGAAAMVGIVLLVGRSGVTSAHTTKELYLIASHRAGYTTPERVQAVRHLVQRKDADEWIVLLLLSSQVRISGGENTPQRARQLAITAVTVKYLPESVSTSVLYAMTYLLDEDREAQWSETHGVILSTHGEMRSKPVRELVRDRLVEYLSVDHGFDADAWRDAIIDRDRDEDGRSGSTTEALDSDESP